MQGQRLQKGFPGTKGYGTMECCIIHCKIIAKYTYTLGEVRFSYCDRHKSIPTKVFDKVKSGFYKGYY